MSVPPVSPSSLERHVGRSAFGVDAQGYDDARSGYPDQLYRHLARRTIPHPTIAEIGSGTGLATEGLLGLSPSQLTLIEPDPRLCAFLEKRFVNASDPADAASAGNQINTQVITAPFPDVEIDDRFDLVTCAAAFHWMEPKPALDKVKSMLTPNGVWAMWWNSYFGHGQPDAFAERMSQIVAEERIKLPPSYSGKKHYAFDVKHHVTILQEAGFRDVEHFVFVTPRTFTASQARHLYASFSFISVLPEMARERMLDRISATIDSEFGGVAHSLYATSLYLSTG